MKRFFFIPVFMAVTAAYATDNDTIVVKKPQTVTIITNDSLQSIHVKGKEDDSHFDYQHTIQLVDSNYVSTEVYNKNLWELIPFGKKDNGKRGTLEFAIIAGLNVGFTTAVGANSGVSVPVGPSWEFMWEIARISYRPWKERYHYFNVGFALDWRNYRMTDYSRFTEYPDGKIAVEEYPQGSNPKFSRVKVLSLSVPITYAFFPWKKSFVRGFEVGPVLNFNTYGSIKSRYTLNGEKQKDFTKDIHRNPFTIDIMARLRMKGIGVYVKYSPSNVLDTNYGPKFRSLSFGFYL